MKKIFILSLIFCFYQAEAQQIHQLTQYMVNDFAYNPAIAGNSDELRSKISFRKQWTGIEGSPTTFLISTHGSVLPNKSVGVGGLLYSDITGPTRRTGLQLAYAYQVRFDDDDKNLLGIGIAGNLMQQSLNFSELILKDENDPQIGTGSQSKLGADAHFGIYFRSMDDEDRLKYFAGFSANQLFASKYTFVGDEESFRNERHFYLTGGYNFNISDDFDLQPAVLLKMVKGTNPQAELNLRAWYQQQYWLGLSYRTQDALSILLGLHLENGFNFSYSYDITTSVLNSVSGGTHEISIGYNYLLRD